MRKIVTIHLLSSKRVQSSRYIREDEVSLAMKKIHKLALSSKHINLTEIIINVTSTIVMRVGFGKRLTGKTGRLEKCLQDLDSFYQSLIDECLVNNENTNSHDQEDQDIVDILIQLKKDQV
ncbi:hypothetical protein CTI12_AA492480 [Artemisia annua]|uniref:Uncharacterized protein n=1 Tax=Artemisia annua TaxID=35608 RepID=A0A2U1LGZ9_ARTAN|nr:hypothetical protein CTI12_AA492480 [Artemisia annua]